MIKKIAVLAKSKLNSIVILISKALIDSVFSHDEFVLIKNVLKQYNKMKEEIKKCKDLIRPLVLACVAKVSECKVVDRGRKFIEDFCLFLK